MSNKNHVKKSLSLLIVLACVFTMLGFGSATVLAGNQVTESEITALYQESLPIVMESGVDPEGHFTNIYNARFGIEDFAYEKMEAICDIAETRYGISEMYTDEVLAKLSYESEKRAKEIRDELLDLLIINQDFASANRKQFSDIKANMEEKSLALTEELNALVVSDASRIFDYISSACQEIKDCYDSLLAFTNEHKDLSERDSPDVYIYAQVKALKEIYENYVVDNNGELSKNDGEGKGFEIVSIKMESYTPDMYAELVVMIDEVVANAKAELKGVPKNNIELAYVAFNDWLYADSNPELDETQKKIELAKATEVIKKGVKTYESANQEVKEHYVSEYKILSEFLKDTTPEAGNYTTNYLSADAVTVLAIYSGTQNEPAYVIPHDLKLQVYPSYNGSAARNAGKIIKESDEKLAVAYVIYMQPYKLGLAGSKLFYDLPTTDENGRAVEYQVEIDLAQYYTKYLATESYYKDQTENITNAHARITGESYTAETSICYAYAHGVANKLNYELKEGGKIVFNTKSLTNFCFTGIDTSTWLSNPLFWVIAVGALILLIIIIKIIRKQRRYSIKFYSNGGSRVKKIKAAKNEYFVMPESPVKEHFVFAGWYTDKALKNKFLGVRMVRRKKIKLYAKWAAPASQERLEQFYDILRKSMMGYHKVSFKPTLGLVEKEHLASIYCRETNVELYLAIDPAKAKEMGFNVVAHEEKKFALLPSKVIVSTEEAFENALKLVKFLFTAKGLQRREDSENDQVAPTENRENGFAYYITNERVASTPADYFELLRLALKGYVLEEDPGIFKAGEKFTFARIYVTDLEAQLYLPTPHGVKQARVRGARFEDTPNLVNVKSANDIPEAFDKIEKVMLSYGFTKCPENSNDLQDVDVPDTNGFAYAVKF